MKTKFEIWKELWDELDDSTKISIRNEYCVDCNSDEEIFPFDESFFEDFFSGAKAIDVARAVFFGNIQSWNDEYIKFNGYGNLESMSTYDAVKDTEDYYLNDIFNHESCWCNEIDEDEIEDEYSHQHWEYIKGEVVAQLPNIDPDLIDEWLNDNWDENEDDDDLINAAVQYYKTED